MATMTGVVNLTDTELQFGEVVAESHPQHITKVQKTEHVQNFGVMHRRFLSNIGINLKINVEHLSAKNIIIQWTDILVK